MFICGRSKEVVIVNGRNYYPQDMEWEAGKVAGVRKGNVVAFGARDPSGVERDRERVVIAFEVQDTERLGAVGERSSAEVRKAVQEGMGLTLDDVVALAARRAAEDLQRQAPAREDARALRDRRAHGPRRRRATPNQARPREARRREPAQLLQARRPRRRASARTSAEARDAAGEFERTLRSEERCVLSLPIPTCLFIALRASAPRGI